MREHTLETADAPQAETAAMHGTPVRRTGSGSLLAMEIKMIRAGARACMDCARAPGTIPTVARTNCEGICVSCQLDRRAALQRETREAMRRRT